MVSSWKDTGKNEEKCTEIRPVCAVTSPANLSRKECPQQLLDLLTSSCHDLDNQQTIRVRQLIEEYHDEFATDDDKTGKTHIIRHKINTGDSQPIRQHPRRVPLAKRKEAERIITDMER
ncbi:hypothetical protein HHI36_009850 [Cryptolaemus montrouzieri]|uniref:Uncharacterized protein n=1 Tax=Cryptolaemus montrouzieri TaxID=559131 RepID=A0ABD2MH35_9CUCU